MTVPTTADAEAPAGGDRRGSAGAGRTTPRPAESDGRHRPLAYQPALDGIRALAVLGVLVYHGGFDWARGGFLGVSAFFTLSGFLITTLLIGEADETGRVSLAGFWGRRFRRLLPASWATIAVVVLLGVFGVWTDGQLSALAGDVPAALAQVLNWRFVVVGRDYGAQFAAPSPLDHYWSLAIEEQFYVLFPLAVAGCAAWATRRRANLRRVVGALAVVLVVVSATVSLVVGDSTLRAYFGTDTRTAELAVGVGLAALLAGRHRLPRANARTAADVGGALGLGFWVWTWHGQALSDRSLFPWVLLGTAVATAAVITAALQRGIVSQLLAAPPLQALGRISYGVYLIHWPVARALTPARTGLGTWGQFALHTAVSIGLAAASYRWFEMPIRRGRPIGFRRAGAVGAAIAAVLLVANAAVTDVEVAPTATERRAEPAAPAPTRVLLVGDQLAGSLDAAARALDPERFQVQVAASPDCGLTEGGWVQLGDGRVELDSDRCASVGPLRDALDGSFRPDAVVVWGGVRDVTTRRLDVDGAWSAPGTPEVDQFLEAGVRELVDGLSAGGAEIVLLTMPVVTAPGDPAPLPTLAPPANAIEEQQRRNEQFALDTVRRDAPAPVRGESLPERVAAFNAVLGRLAGGRVRVVDTAPLLAGATVGAAGVDATAAQTLTDAVAKQVADAERKRPAAAKVEAPTAELPAAPPAAPRRTPGPVIRTSVVGDSVGITIANGLSAWGRSGAMAVTDRTVLGCPVARGGLFRAGQDTQGFPDRCQWGEPGGYATALAEDRADVIALVGGAWDVLDRLPEGATAWEHVGEPSADRFLLAELLRAVDLLGSDGARVVLLTSAHVKHGQAQGFTDLPESEPSRIDRYNELVREAAELRPGVATVIDLAAWVQEQPGGEFAAGIRSDGVHYDPSFAGPIGEWLGPRLVDLARS